MDEPFFIHDNSSKSIAELDDKDKSAFNCIANKTVQELISINENLLVFSNNRKDKINKQTIFRLNSDHKLETNNLVGFLGIDDVHINIGSRFSEKDGKQFFIQYMLQKIYNLPVIDFKTNSGNLQIWEQLLYLIFPIFLKKAYNQGVFKIYQKRFYNDCNVKGKIDIPRHIKSNLPFIGNVAYNNKELSLNNPVTQLIRHTIEFIACKNGFSQVLTGNSEMHNAVRAFKSITPDYHIMDRQKLIIQNYKKVNHPFYTEYEPLRKLCIQILTHEGISFHNSPNKVYGIIIDAAWLWEEYLNTILRDLGFKHPESNIGKGSIKLFQKNQDIYPDFYIENQIVIDAKYKKLKEDNKVSREDIYQVITYMYRLQAKYGVLLYPIEEHTKPIKHKKFKMHENSLGGNEALFMKLGMTIPKEIVDYKGFCEEIKVVEEELIEICLQYVKSEKIELESKMI